MHLRIAHEFYCAWAIDSVFPYVRAARVCGSANAAPGHLMQGGDDALGDVPARECQQPQGAAGGYSAYYRYRVPQRFL